MINSSSKYHPAFLLLCIGVVAAFVPNMLLHFAELWDQEQHQYFPFVLAAIGWLGWNRWKEAVPLDEPRTRFLWIPVVSLSLALPLLALSIYSQWPWLTAVALNLTAAAAVYHVTRKVHIRNAWGIWSLMWLLTPPPIEFGGYMVRKLQLVSSNFSSQILDLIRINHLMQGNTLHLSGKELFVDEACSGIVSILSVIAVVAICAVWQDRSLLHFSILGITGVTFAVLMNTVRICAIAFAEARYSVDLADGWQHEVLGLTLFAITFLAVISTDRMLLFMFDPIEISDMSRNPMIRFWNSCVRALTPKHLARSGKVENITGFFTNPSFRFLGITMLILGLWSSLVMAGVMGDRTLSVDVTTVHQSVDKGVLNKNIGGWNLDEFEAIERGDDSTIHGYEFGRYSKQFYFKRENVTAMVSMDFPFRGGWHELAACYRASGWTIKRRDSKTSDGVPYVEADLEMDDGKHAFLAFSNFHANGQVLTPASSAVLSHVWLFIRRRLLEEVTRDVYQVQVLVESDDPLSDDDREAIRTLFVQCHKAITSEVEELAAATAK